MQSEPGAGRETCPLTSLELLAKSPAAQAQQTGGGDANVVPTSLSWSQPKGGPQAVAPEQPPAAAEQRPRSHESVPCSALLQGPSSRLQLPAPALAPTLSPCAQPKPPSPLERVLRLISLITSEK